MMNRNTLVLLCYVLFQTSNLFSQNTAVFPFYEFAKKYSIGQVMPKDQGGMFVQMDIFGNEDDEQIVQKIRNGILEKIYGNPIKWNKFEKTEIEKSVWLNRFYYLPSFARMYYLTNDTSYVTDMMNIIKSWSRDNPWEPGIEKKTYNWRDMQVAWRSINLSWCYYLTEKALNDTDKRTIHSLQQIHANILLSWFGKQQLNDFNHQSHGALAMLYLATLFPKLDNTQELQRGGIRILTHHLKHAHYNDGGNVEQMFGYYPFQTSIFRDAYLLGNANKSFELEGGLSMLNKMADFIYNTAQPNHTTPAINDSYEIDVLPSLAILQEIIKRPLTKPASSSIYYPNTQIAFIRAGRPGKDWYISLNPAMRIGTHAHAGRLAFNLWFGGKPLFVDAGCCSYDNPIKNRYYRRTEAHNSVLIDNCSDAELSSNNEYAKLRITNNRIVEWIDTEKYVYARMISQRDDPTNSNVEWSRSVVLVKDEFVLAYDQFIGRGKHSYQLLFHLPPVQICVNKKDKSVIAYNDSLVSIIPLNKKALNTMMLTQEYLYVSGNNFKAPMLNYTYKKNGNLRTLFLIMPKENDFILSDVEQKEDANGIGIMLTKKNGTKVLVLLKDADKDELILWGSKTTKNCDIIIL